MISLISEPPSDWQRRTAALVVAASALICVALGPFANLPMGHTRLFLPIYESALVMCDFVTCVFLFSQSAISRSLGMLMLAAGYLFSAVMALMHELSFPGLFAHTGLLWAGPQTTAWLFFLWYMGFPMAVGAYALLASHAPVPRESMRRALVLAVLGVLVLVAIAVALSTLGASALPKLMRGDHDRPAKYVLAWITWLVALATVPMLWRRQRFSGMDLWLIVVMVAWACDIAQSAVFNAGRFSLGWYTGRAYGLAASSFLLTLLILETGRLHRRLAQLHQVEHEQRRLAEDRATELNHLADSLDDRVRSRTNELEHTNAALRRTRDALRDTAARGAAAREEERARMARELHDELDQTLLMLKFELADLEAQCRQRGAPVPENIQTMQGLLDQTLETAKRVAADLRPTVLDVLGLDAAARWLVQSFTERNMIAVRLAVDPKEIRLEEPHATVVFRVLQEALTNVARHAQASRVDVELALNADHVLLSVTDDGRGFDVAVPHRSNAFGLLGMHERAAMVSGSLEIVSSPGCGTKLSLQIPLAGPVR